jgi:phosphoenolpyruvate carboxylase
VIRAFSYFSHLANIAEDRHHLRRRAVHERQGHLQRGSLQGAFERLARRGVGADDIARTLEHAWISPVLTAHPTEVQRKSILDAERAIAELLAARTPELGERDAARNVSLIRARVTQLWQTRMLRSAKLTVDDEIENALSYYRATFLTQIPELYREIEEALPGFEIAPFFRMGNWIGGDRDGNPFVSAATLATALARQSETALRHYLTQVHELGAEMSSSANLSTVSPALQVSKIKIPILLIHGTEDSIVPIAQSRTMKKALDKAGMKTELIELEKEDHGGWEIFNEIRVLTAIDQFLWKHLGPGHEVKSPPPTAVASK